MAKLSTIKSKLVVTTALAAALFGYGRRAYADCFGNAVAPNYLCTGAPNVTQTITYDNANVYTAAGFSNTAPGGDAIHITGDGALSFTDANDSTLNGFFYGLNMVSYVDDGLIPGSITINTDGTITGTLRYGIRAVNYNGSGALSISADGDITGKYGGIYARNGGIYGPAASDLTITTGENSTVTGTKANGIDAVNFGSGALSISADGDITGGGGRGILAINHGSSAISISASGDVTGDSWGIDAINYASGTDLSIATGANSTITGGFYGIEARNFGSGALTITANGDVLGGYKGIYAKNFYYGTDLTITTGAGSSITGTNSYGIYAHSYGTGDLTITADGDVSGGSNGILAKNSSYGIDLAITTGNGTSVTGTNGIGIYARSDGSGDLTVSADGDVMGDTRGIYTYNSGSGNELTISTGTGTAITGTDYEGIRARNFGSGNLTITAKGDVLGGNRGIYARNFYGDTLTITTGKGTAVTGTISEGINARNNGGGGALMITADGEVTGGNRGILALNYGTKSLSVAANGDVTGGSKGVYARNYGTDLTITSWAGSTITGTKFFGIDALNSGSGALTISTDGDVIGKYRGISANNQSTKEFMITANGDVTGDTIGIDAVNSGADMTIITGKGTTVTSANYYGIYAQNNGTAALMITANGDVSGGQNGIRARNAATASDLTVTTGKGTAVTGTNDDGIHAYNLGTGPLTVDTQGYVFGASAGIHVENSGGSGALTVTAHGDVRGFSSDGINAHNSSTNALTITTYGKITADPAGNGIYGLNKGTNLTITAFGPISGARGIGAMNRGSGALTITTQGDITGEAAGAQAIMAYNYGTDLSIKTGKNTAVTGGNRGIWAVNHGTGKLNITNGVGADIYGGSAGLFVTGLGASGSSIVNNGTIDGGDYGVKLDNAVIDGSLVNSGNAVISDLGVAGLYVGGGSDLTKGVNNKGTITGVIGVEVNAAKISGGFTTSNKVEGTGGTAINLTGLTGSTPIIVRGGRIIGDVIDDAPANGYSPVTIAGDFTSEGNFDVSDFDVLKNVTFTMGGGTTITSFNTVDVFGTFSIPFDPLIVGDVNVHTKGLLDVQAGTTITGYLQNNGTVSIATGTTVEAGTMLAGTKGTLSFGVTSESDHGQLTLDSSPGDMTGQTVTVDVAKVNGIKLSDEILIVDGTTTLIGGPGKAGAPVTDNSPFWTFKMVDGTGITNITDDSDLFLVIDKSATIDHVSNCANCDGTASTLLDLPDGAGPELEEIVDNLNNAATTGEATDILKSVQPPEDGGSAVSTLTFVDNSVNLVTERLDGLINDTGMSGLSAGASDMPGKRVWYQVSGQIAQQGAVGCIGGFKSSLMAATVGMDTENILENGILGVAISYGNTHIDSLNPNRTDTNIDNYQATLYSDYQLGHDFYVNGIASGAFNSHSTLRHDVGAIPGLNAYGDFNSWQAAARAEAGRPFYAGDATFTPVALVNWVYYNADDYTETGAGSANLNVGTKALNQLDLGLGGKLSGNFTYSDGTHLVPEVHVIYRREMLGERLETTSAFIGGGAAFSGESPDPAQNKFNLGAQVKYYALDNLELSAAYDFDVKQDFISHAGFLRAGWKF